MEQEIHHLFDSSTVMLPKLEHRKVTKRGTSWPAELKKPTDPLLIIIAAFLRTLADFAAWVLAYAERASDYLLSLYRLLTEQGISYADSIAPLAVQ